MDRLSRAHRSWLMSKVRSKDTTPEMIVRRAVHKLGYRYRLHCPKMPGKPDLVLSAHRKIIFVHGCFWHGHENCSKARLPKSNVEFWRSKIERNVGRDTELCRMLIDDGWDVLIVWQCQTKDLEGLVLSLRSFLEKDTI